MRQEISPDDNSEFILNNLYDDIDKRVGAEKKQLIQNQEIRSSSNEKLTSNEDDKNNENDQKKKKGLETLDYHDTESMMYRKHETRRFFQDRGHFWNKFRLITTLQWGYVILVGIIIGCVGSFTTTMINILLNWKFKTALDLISNENWAGAFFAYQFMSIFYVSIAAVLCYFQPLAIGGGISEIKAFLNGVNLNQFVNVRIVLAKILGICFSIGAGLPIGKKGPLIQIGSIIATIISQGKSEVFKLDMSWTKVQDFRNDKTKRDFVTYGTAAGVAAGFRSPIGGVLFALEEGASFWSSSTTIQSFFCALVTMLTITIIFQRNGLGASNTDELFVFGQFKDFKDGKTNYRTYELFIFMLMGISGGFLGAVFNDLHLKVSNYYSTHMTTPTLKVVRVILYTIVMACVSFILPLMWQKCTPLPTAQETAGWTDYEIQNLDRLVQFQCKDDEYNQLASLYFVNANQCLAQLFHFREYNGSTYTSFTLGPLFLFFISYFIMTILTGGLAIPMGLFIPSLVAGAAYGRIWGHILNLAFSDSVADSGTYALMGAAAINGGVTRITLAMTIIMLETAGNMTYLLPLMITFGAARYSGKIFNEGIYDMLIEFKKFPYLDSTLHTLGLLNQNPVTEIMATPAITLLDIDKVSKVYNILKQNKHNGFPIVDRENRLLGLILRKTLCVLLELRSFSSKASPNDSSSFDENDQVIEEGGIKLSSPALVFYETLEKKYPKYPDIDNIALTSEEMNLYLDLRPYMDTSPFMIHESASVSRCHHEFRTLGLRHMVVIDSFHHVVGIITRKDITNKTLKAHWEAQGEHMEKYVNIEPLPAPIVFEEQEKSLSPATKIKAYSTLHQRNIQNRNLNTNTRKSIESVKNEYGGEDDNVLDD